MDRKRLTLDPIGIDAAVEKLSAVVEGSLDRVGATVITIGPITIPAFTITVEMPPNAHE